MHRVKYIASTLPFSKRILPKNYLRPLSVKEKLLLELGDRQMLQYSSVLFVSSKQQLVESNIQQSLQCIARRHPLLQACVVKENSKYYWKQMDTIKINFKTDPSTDWEKVFSDTLYHRHNLNTGPLWQIIYFPNVVSEFADKSLPYHSAFVLNTNHAILDGQGKPNVSRRC